MSSIRLMLGSALLLPACFMPAQQGGGGGGPAPAYSEPAGTGDPAAAPEPAGPAGPVVVSVQLRNTCPNTVKLFFGDKPKYGSGTSTTLSANSVTSYQKQEGDMIWIVDESDNGISSMSVSAASRNIEITQSCTGMTVR